MTEETETRLIHLLEEIKKIVADIQTNQQHIKELKHNNKFLSNLRVSIGYVFQISVVFGIPLFGYLMGQKWFPHNQLLQHLSFTLAILIMFCLVNIIEVDVKNPQSFQQENLCFYDLFKTGSAVIGVMISLATLLQSFFNMTRIN